MAKYFEQALLVAYLVYLGFIPSVTIPHSIILVSLASLFAFRQYLQWQEQPSLEQELAKLRESLENQVNGQKESCNARLQKIEDEMGKVAMSIVRQPVSSSSPRKTVF